MSDDRTEPELVELPTDEDRGDLLVDGDRVMTRTIVLVALYLLLAGHNRPGGGFVGGLVIAAAVVLRAQGSGVRAALRLLPLPPTQLLGLGLALVVGISLSPLLGGGGILDQPYVEPTLPLFGEVKLTSSLVFDVGVVAIVAGMVGAIVDVFGDRGLPIDTSDLETRLARVDRVRGGVRRSIR